MFDLSHLNQQLQWRYATKKFDTEKKLTNEQVDSIVEAMRMAPSSFGLQPWRFVVITNSELRAKLKEASFGQSQVTDASHLVVVAHRSDVAEVDIDNYLAAHVRATGQSLEDLAGYRAVMVGAVAAKTPEERAAWAARQAYIALGFGLETAALMGIDAAPMEGFNAGAVTDILGLRELGYQAVVYMALGYRSAEDKQADVRKVRFAPEQVTDWRL